MIVETLLIGLVVALLWAEVTDISPGGLIVPGYLASISTVLSGSPPLWPWPWPRWPFTGSWPGGSSCSGAAASS